MAPIHILLAEDNPDHAELTMDTLREVEPNSRISHYRQGEELLLQLRQMRHDQGGGRPDLVMLDIKMPRLNGKEVLWEIKQDPLLSSLPVLMITTSSNDRDLKECFELGAAGYLIKPISREELARELARQIGFIGDHG